jgi:hypothetical protein
MGGGKGWADCQDKSSCKVAVDSKANVGRAGTAGVEFTARGKQWMGFGWNWFGWWPADSGTDASKYEKLRFWMKITVEPGKKKPSAEAWTVALTGSSKGGKDMTESVHLNDYVQGFVDGEWHEIAVPLQELRHGKGATFDASKTWEIDIGAWSEDECEYKIAVDDIGFI